LWRKNNSGGWQIVAGSWQGEFEDWKMRQFENLKIRQLADEQFIACPMGSGDF